MNGQPIDSLPAWAVYPFLVAVLLLALWGGFRYTKARGRAGTDSDEGLGAISAAALGLLAFLLAFIMGFGFDLYGDRRALVLDEANAIRSAYLRAGYLEDPYRSEARELLTEYVNGRVWLTQHPEQVAPVQQRAEEIQAELWRSVEELVLEGEQSDTTSAYVDSVNEVITLHVERVVKGLEVRIPPLAMVCVLAITVVTVFLVGMQSAYGAGRSILGLVLMVFILAAVLYLLVDLDRAQEGIMKVSQQPLIDLQQQLPSLP